MLPWRVVHQHGREGRLRGRPVVAHGDVEGHRPFHRSRVPADGGACRLEKRPVGVDDVGRAEGIPQVGVTGDQRQRPLRPRAADEERQRPLNRERGADGIGQAVVAAIVRDDLAVVEATEQPDRLSHAFDPLTRRRTEVQPEGTMLLLEPAGTDAQDCPAIRDVVQRGGHLREQAGMAEGVGGDEVADCGAGRDRRRSGRHRPTLELWGSRLALVGKQVVVEPERVEAGGIGLLDRLPE